MFYSDVFFWLWILARLLGHVANTVFATTAATVIRQGKARREGNQKQCLYAFCILAS